MNEVRSSADLAIVNECWLRRWTPSRAARAILSFQPVLERIQYLYFIIFWKKEWKLNRNIGSSKLNSPLSFFLFSLLSSFPFPFSFSSFFFCIRAPPAPKICRVGSPTFLRFLSSYRGPLCICTDLDISGCRNKGPGARAGHFPSFFSLFCNAKNPFFQQDP